MQTYVFYHTKLEVGEITDQGAQGRDLVMVGLPGRCGGEVEV